MIDMILEQILSVAYAVYKSWNKIVNWFQDFLPKREKAWNELKIAVAHAAKVFADVVLDGLEELVRIMHKTYWQEDNGQWMERTTTRACPEEEVPADIREKIRKQKEGEVDITHELENKLQLEI